MNRQATLTKIKTHLLKQNKKALIGIGIGCAYRSSNGLKCAIGCLIPDDVYDPKMEGDLDELLDKFPEMREVFGIQKDDDLEFLLDAQSVHDTGSPNEWPEQLALLAKQYNLEYEEV